MALSNNDILDAATLEYQIEMDRGLSLGEQLYPFMPLVKPIRPEQRIDSPVSNKVTLIWSEPDIRLKKDTGEVSYKSLPLRERSIEVEKYVDGIAEDLHRLRLRLVRAEYAKQVQVWAANGVRFTQFEQAWDRLLQGNTATYGLTEDGQFMFDTDHPGKTKDGADTTFANLYALSLGEANLNTVIQAMQQYRTITGLPVGNVWRSSSMMFPQSSREQVSPANAASFHLFVGPTLANTAHDLARMAVDNPSKFAGSFTWSTIAQLDGSHANRWFVMWLDPQRRPLSFIDDGAALIVRDGYDTEPGRTKGRAEWILRAVWGFSYDRWDVISMSTGAP
jgi:hypothetical protein